MCRSLKLETNTITTDFNGGVYYISVIVDNITDNASFTLNALNEGWFSCSTERYKNRVIIKVAVDKNNSTQERYGTIEVRHNCAKISNTISITQCGVEYEIKMGDDIENPHYQVFKTIPSNDNIFEEKRIPITAIGGSNKWYVKGIYQYQVCESDGFSEETYVGLSEQEKNMVQNRTNYDGVFKYYIENNTLVIRSYGQIDLTNKSQSIKEDGTKPHMRYFFIISHRDVNGKNKIYLDEKDEYAKQTKRYEDKILCLFDGDDNNNYSQ